MEFHTNIAKNREYGIIVVGSGPAGATAAISAARKNPFDMGKKTEIAHISERRITRYPPKGLQISDGTMHGQ